MHTIGGTLEIAKVPIWARLPLMDMYQRDRCLRVGTDRGSMGTHVGGDGGL